MELVFLLVAALAIYAICERNDASLDKHPPIKIKARYPDVYDAVVKTIRTFSFEDYSWSLTYADPDQGYIQAKCRFREQVSSDLRAERRSIDLNIHMRELEDEMTEMQFSFVVMSAYGRMVAAQIIQHTEGALQMELQETVWRAAA